MPSTGILQRMQYLKEIHKLNIEMSGIQFTFHKNFHWNPITDNNISDNRTGKNPKDPLPEVCRTTVEWHRHCGAKWVNGICRTSLQDSSVYLWTPPTCLKPPCESKQSKQYSFVLKTIFCGLCNKIILNLNSLFF